MSRETAQRILLEIAVETPAEAELAQQCGADRIELSRRLDVGGLTPSPALVRAVRAVCEVPLMVLVRPRPGDFHFSAEELREMESEISAAMQNRADGVVFGALRHDGAIDIPACERLVRCCGAAIPVFHRAFDGLAQDPASLEPLVELRFQRVLTAGTAQGGLTSTALDGKAALAQLVHLAAGRIEILPGGGVRPGNVAQLVHETGCDQVHSSARVRGRLDAATVRELRRRLDACP